MKLKELEMLMQVCYSLRLHATPARAGWRGGGGEPKSRRTAGRSIPGAEPDRQQRYGWRPSPPLPPAAGRWHASTSDHLALAILAQDIAPFEDPKIELEQYPTGPHLASRLLFTVREGVKWQELARHGRGCLPTASRGCCWQSMQVANSYDEFEGQSVIDLGCGTAMLRCALHVSGAWAAARAGL